jgi:hypothetical protein
LSMISGQTLRACPEGKPVPTFSDHALGSVENQDSPWRLGMIQAFDG